jgi:hypothetical protein
VIGSVAIRASLTWTPVGSKPRRSNQLVDLIFLVWVAGWVVGVVGSGEGCGVWGVGRV